MGPEDFDRKHLVITGLEAKHGARVLRLAPGDLVMVGDGAGREARAKITDISNREIICEKLAEVSSRSEPPLKVTLVQGIPKGDKMELVIQKATELGAIRVVPAVCRRTVVQLKEDRVQERCRRWQRVAAEAAKQCGRATVPRVADPVSFAGALEMLPGQGKALGLIPWEEEIAVTLGEVLKAPPAEEVFIFIGPEGGFDPGEVRAARDAGVVPVTLGPRILRTETAGLTCLSIVMYLWGDLGGQH